MKVFYFIHITGTDTGISGIPRVVKNLGRELVLLEGIDLVFVCWSQGLRALVHAEQKQLDNLARHGGPKLEETSRARKPIEAEPGDWLLFAEAPHLHSYDREYPSLSISEPIGVARSCGLKVAAIFHDILPLLYDFGGPHRGVFADMTPGATGHSDGEVQRLQFALYAHSLALADVVFPVSRTTGDQLFEWLIQQGHRAELLPLMPPILLPEEVFGVERVIPHRRSGTEGSPLEFLAVGTVCAHKNQLGAMYAFHRLIQRRRELDLRLNIVGTIAAGSATAASLMAKRADGRIILHGHLPDEQLEALQNRARASVFVSLAEGYGLPVTESLWRGKPCLCSGEGSIAEIARGGGCLQINPRSLDEIAAGFETLAIDRSRYDELLHEIATRKMKSWKEYADEIVEKLAAYSSEGDRRLETSQLLVESPQASSFSEAAVAETGTGPPAVDGCRDAIYMVYASDFSLHEAYVSDRARSIRYKSAIRYDHAKDGAVPQKILFYGPYAALPAGRYKFVFDGELEGELDLSFTAEAGARKIARFLVSNFDEPVTVELAEAVKKFEIVASRTLGLKHLVLRSVFAEFRSSLPHATEAPAPFGAMDSEGDTPVEEPADFAATHPEAAPPAEEHVYARDDDGKALSLPFALPADKMRVHDAYGVGSQNRLRANSTISFAVKRDAHVAEPVLFFGPYFDLEPGNYSFRFRGALEGSLRLRFTKGFAAECLHEVVVTSFDVPVQVVVEAPAEKFEIIGERLKNMKAMTLASIELAVQPLTSRRKPPSGAEAKASGGLLDRAARLLRLRLGSARHRNAARVGDMGTL